MNTMSKQWESFKFSCSIYQSTKPVQRIRFRFRMMVFEIIDSPTDTISLDSASRIIIYIFTKVAVYNTYGVVYHL